MAKNPRLIPMTGKRYGSWLVFEQTGNTKGGGAIWRCVCDCGTVRNVNGGDMRSGKSTNCGCVAEVNLRAAGRKHGDTGTRLYRVWANMRRRCNVPSNPGFRYYGARGIKVCAAWNADYVAFRDWALANGFSEELTLDRIDCDGDYEPSNCRWADRLTQAQNRRFVRKSPDGRPWSRVAIDNGIPRAVYANRLHSGGWSPEKAATWPLGVRNQKRERTEAGRFAKGPRHWKRHKTDVVVGH